MDDLFANAVCQSYDSPDVSSDENTELQFDQDDVFDDDPFMDDNFDETLPVLDCSDPAVVAPSCAPQGHVVRT